MGRNKINKKKLGKGTRKGFNIMGKKFFGRKGNRWTLHSKLTSPNWNEMQLEDVRKDFYQEHELVKARSENEIKDFMSSSRMTVKGHDCPKPVQAFEECDFSGEIMSALKAHNYEKPTPIQCQALPVALSGRNIVGIAETGSGKTLAFILPALTHILGKQCQRNKGEPDVVVLAPTRELAQQIYQVADSLKPYVNVSSECFYGGTKRLMQTDNADKVFEICIATPGRLVDFLGAKIVRLHRCTYVVLDEADRMLDMGFEPQIKLILGQIRPDRQILMFSATWPTEIRQMAENYLRDYIMINIGSLEIAANHNITQQVTVCEENEKPQRICKIMNSLMEQKDHKTLIFCNSKIGVDILTLKFRMNGWDAVGLHGNMSQNDRDQVFGNFKNGKVKLLIATDVAARGLDVDDIKYIINYDFPMCCEDYVHRIGRTARVNRTGTSISLFTQLDRDRVEFLISILKEANQHVNPELLKLAASPQLPKGKKNRPGMKALKNSLKLRKKELKKLITRKFVNTAPLGTVTNTDTLPELNAGSIDGIPTRPPSKKQMKREKKAALQQRVAPTLMAGTYVQGNRTELTSDNCPTNFDNPFWNQIEPAEDSISDMEYTLPKRNFPTDGYVLPQRQSFKESSWSSMIQRPHDKMVGHTEFNVARESAGHSFGSSSINRMSLMNCLLQQRSGSTRSYLEAPLNHSSMSTGTGMHVNEMSLMNCQLQQRSESTRSNLEAPLNHSSMSTGTEMHVNGMSLMNCQVQQRSEFTRSNLEVQLNHSLMSTRTGMPVNARNGNLAYYGHESPGHMQMPMGPVNRTYSTNVCGSGNSMISVASSRFDTFAGLGGYEARSNQPSSGMTWSAGYQDPRASDSINQRSAGYQGPRASDLINQRSTGYQGPRASDSINHPYSRTDQGHYSQGGVYYRNSDRSYVYGPQSRY